MKRRTMARFAPRTVGTDLTLESDVNVVAEIAFGIAEKVRDDDPVELHRHLAALCLDHPMRAAQLIMCFAAWFDVDCTTDQLWDRVDRILDGQLQAAS